MHESFADFIYEINAEQEGEEINQMPGIIGVDVQGFDQVHRLAR